MSKSSKKCGYVFLKGKREGEKCGKSCRGDFCGDHNPKKKEYSKKYYHKKNTKRGTMTHKQRIRKLKKCVIDKLPSENYCNLRIRNIVEAGKELYMTTLGVGLIADPEKYESLIEKKIKKDRNNPNIIPTKHYIEFTGSQENASKILDKLLRDRDTLIRRLKNMQEILQIVKTRLENKENNI